MSCSLLRSSCGVSSNSSNSSSSDPSISGRSAGSWANLALANDLWRSLMISTEAHGMRCELNNIGSEAYDVCHDALCTEGVVKSHATNLLLAFVPPGARRGPLRGASGEATNLNGKPWAQRAHGCPDLVSCEAQMKAPRSGPRRAPGGSNARIRVCNTTFDNSFPM